MTVLTLDISNRLAADEDIQSLVGSSSNFPVWVFEDRPWATIEGTQTSMVVVTEDTPFSEVPAFGTIGSSRVHVDIWSDCTRNSDGSVQVRDADDKIKAIVPHVMKYLHTVNLDTPSGYPRKYGSSYILAGEVDMSGVILSDVFDSDGTRMGRLTFTVTTL